MRRRLLLVALVALLPVLASGAQFVRYESLTVADTAVGFTKATVLDPAGYPQSNFCTARVVTAQINMRFDGTAPTSSVGTPLEVGDIVEFNNHEDADRALFIRTTATSGGLRVHCGVR